jgi:hypothetical protein
MHGRVQFAAAPVDAILYLLASVATVAAARRLVPFSRRAAAALVVLPLLFTGAALVSGRVYAPVDIAYSAEPLASLAPRVGVTHIANAAVSDVYAQFLPWNAALRWSVAHHQWPLWNPFELGGGILAAAAQSAPYHPVTLLALLLPQGEGVTFAAAMTIFLAALSLFLLARELELSELASLFGAAAWAFSQHLVTFTHTAHGSAVGMMPFVLLAARRVARDPGPRTAALLTGALTLLLLCGHPESALHVVFLASLFALLELPQPRRAVGYALAAGVATLQLTAVFLLPLFDAMPQTREYLHRTSTRGDGRTSATLAQVAHVLPGNLVPFIEGESGVEAVTHTAATGHAWAGSGYAGALALAPALIALRRRRGKLTWFFAVAALFGLLIGAEAPGLTELFQHLPLFSIAINARMISFAALGVSMLAAIGMDVFLRRRVRLDLACAIVAVTLMILIAALLPSLRASGLTLSFLRLKAARELLPLLLGFAVCRVAASPRLAAVGLVALLLLQRSGEAGGRIPTLPSRAFYPPIAGLPSRDDRQPFRIAALGSLLPPDLAAHYELEDVRGYQAMTLARLAATFPLWCTPQAVWSNRVDDLTAPMLSLLNVRYALAPPRTPPPPGWRTRGAREGFDLLENSAVLPRAFLPRIVHEGAPPASVIAAMASCRDFANEAWIESDGAPLLRDNGTGRIDLRREGTRLRMHVAMDAPGWVVVSEPAWRGWRVEDHGRPLELHFADSAFVGFHLDAGPHDIRMFYRPRSFVAGAWISGLSALLLATAWAILRRRHELLGS